MGNKSDQNFREEFLQYVNGYFNIPNYLSDIVQPQLKSSVWSIFTAIWRKTIGYQKWEAKISISLFHKLTGLSAPTIIKALHTLEELDLIIVKKNSVGFGRQSGKGQTNEIVEKFGGEASTIEINQEPLKIFKWLENEPLKNLYRGHLKNFNGFIPKPLKKLYRLKTSIKNNKNSGNDSLKPSKNNYSREESAQKLEEIIKMLDKKYPGNGVDNYFEELDKKGEDD